MDNYTQTATRAAQGHDTEDFLQHIAWTDVILPSMEAAKATITKQLVASILAKPDPNSDTREQLAGKLFGIDFVTSTIARIVREGRHAKDSLAKENLFLQ